MKRMVVNIIVVWMTTHLESSHLIWQGVHENLVDNVEITSPPPPGGHINQIKIAIFGIIKKRLKTEVRKRKIHSFFMVKKYFNGSSQIFRTPYHPFDI